MIELDGARMVFATSFNYYDPHVLKLAGEYPNIAFFHCGGLWDEKIHPANVYTYFGYIDECVYLSGIVAGHATRSKKLGFVAGKPIPQVLRNVNAFTLGARSVDPTIQCLVVFTGDWSKPVQEAESANSLIDQGVDVLTCHVNSPKVVIETAERRGIYSCGYHCNQQALAPRGFLAGAEWNWEKLYVDFVKDFQAGKKIPNMVRGGLREGIVKPAPYGPAAPAEARQAAEAARARLLEGSFAIFKGPLKNNAGKEVIPAGKAYPQTAIELESMDYLVEGVIGQ
jgi:simple sugar transport system substrate-binding protein